MCKHDTLVSPFQNLMLFLHILIAADLKADFCLVYCSFCGIGVYQGSPWSLKAFEYFYEIPWRKDGP